MTKTKLSDLLREAFERIQAEHLQVTGSWHACHATVIGVRLLAEAERLEKGHEIALPVADEDFGFIQGWLAACGGEVNGK